MAFLTRKEASEILGLSLYKLCQIINYQQHLNFPASQGTEKNRYLYDEDEVMAWADGRNCAAITCHNPNIRIKAKAARESAESIKKSDAQLVLNFLRSAPLTMVGLALKHGKRGVQNVR